MLDPPAGETIVIDTGHVVAYDLRMQFNARRAVRCRTIQSLKSGEDLVFEFVGLGQILLRTRNPAGLAIGEPGYSGQRLDWTGDVKVGMNGGN